MPVPAVQRGEPGLTFVYVVNANATLISVRPVKLGPTDGGFSAVTSGLQPGEKVVTDGTDRLRDGAPVTVPTPGQAPAGGKPAAQPAAAQPAPTQPATTQPATGQPAPAQPAPALTSHWATSHWATGRRRARLGHRQHGQQTRPGRNERRRAA